MNNELASHGGPAAPMYGSVDEAIKAYVQMRDDLKVLRDDFTAAESSLKGLMEQTSMFLRDKGDELGVDSFKTASGTAYRNVKKQYRVANWAEYMQWMKETDNLHCVEKRAAKLAVQEIHNETGIVPPGLDFHTEVEFDVRRPTK